MNAERRGKAILLFLAVNGRSTMSEIAAELCCSRRTIESDVLTLAREYPIETKKGNGGGVWLMEGYTPLRRGYDTNDIENLKEILKIVNEELGKTIHKVLSDLV